jgi:hypothetical protein
MRYPNGSVLERYTGIVPIEGMAKCDVNALGTYAGFGVADINDIPNVAELVMRLAEELKGP